MSQLLDEAIKALESSNPNAIQDALGVIGEVAAVNRISGFSSDVVPDANKEILARPELEKLQKIVIRFIEGNPDDSNVVSAFWTLGKFRDKALEPLYARWLEHYFQNAIQPVKIVGQILVSMNDSGIKVISGSSWSFDDYGKNLSDAAAYLKKNKKS